MTGSRYWAVASGSARQDLARAYLDAFKNVISGSAFVELSTSSIPPDEALRGAFQLPPVEGAHEWVVLKAPEPKPPPVYTPPVLKEGEQVYYVSQGPFGMDPPLEVISTFPPPCIWCSKPVFYPSMDGPLVCGPCDCGYDDGPAQAYWSKEKYEQMAKQRSENIARYRAKMEERRIK